MTSHSPSRYARIAGALYLVNIVLGFYAIGYVPSAILAGDMAATAQHVKAHELLYRTGLAAHMIMLFTNIPLAVAFYNLFKDVNRNLTLCMIIATLIGTSVEAAGLLTQISGLVLLKGHYLGAFPQAQLDAGTYFGFQLSAMAYDLATAFFGCYGMLMGRLIIRSGLFSRVIGVLMSLGGACYLLHSFTRLVFPAFNEMLVPWIQLPSGLAELSFCLYMLISGVKRNRKQPD